MYDIHVCCCLGKALCGTGTCQQNIGPQLKYKQGRRQYGYALGKVNVMWRLDSETEFKAIKQWSKVPFHIDEDSG